MRAALALSGRRDTGSKWSRSRGAAAGLCVRSGREAPSRSCVLASGLCCVGFFCDGASDCARAGAARRFDTASAAVGRGTSGRAVRGRGCFHGRERRVQRLGLGTVEVGPAGSDRPGHGVGHPDPAGLRPWGADRIPRLHAAYPALPRPVAGAAARPVAGRAVALGDRHRRGLERSAALGRRWTGSRGSPTPARSRSSWPTTTRPTAPPRLRKRWRSDTAWTTGGCSNLRPASTGRSTRPLPAC